MRSLPHRMKLQYKRRYDLYGVDVGLLHEKALRWTFRCAGILVHMLATTDMKI